MKFTRIAAVGVMMLAGTVYAQQDGEMPVVQSQAVESELLVAVFGNEASGVVAKALGEREMEASKAGPHCMTIRMGGSTFTTPTPCLPQ